MNSPQIEQLVNKLNLATVQSTEFLNESVFDKIDSVYSKIKEHTDASSKVSGSMKKLIEQVRAIPATDECRVVTYPNIHSDNKYDIHASVLIDYVFNKIDEAIKNQEKIDAVKVNREAMGYTLYKLIRYTPSKEITIDQFKEEYRKQVFGSDYKVQLVPNITTLIRLAERNPYTISYIDRYLISNGLKDISNRAKKIESDVTKLGTTNPSIKEYAESYMSAIERAISNLWQIYEYIKRIFSMLNSEYKKIFMDIIKISKITNESFTYLNDTFRDSNKIIPLNENSDSEKGFFNQKKEIKSSIIEIRNCVNKIDGLMSNSINNISSKISLCAKIDTNNIPSNLEYTFPDGIINGSYKKKFARICKLVNDLNKTDIADKDKYSELIGDVLKNINDNKDIDYSIMDYIISDDLSVIVTPVLFDVTAVRLMELKKVLGIIQTMFKKVNSMIDILEDNYSKEVETISPKIYHIINDIEKYIRILVLSFNAYEIISNKIIFMYEDIININNTHERRELN